MDHQPRPSAWPQLRRHDRSDHRNAVYPRRTRHLHRHRTNTGGSATTNVTISSVDAPPALAYIPPTVNVLPVAVGTISGPVNVSIGSSSAQFSAAVTGAVDKSVTWSTSAGSITSAGLLTAPATAQDIIITATSIADSTQHSQTTVHVLGLPLATGSPPPPTRSSTEVQPQSQRSSPREPASSTRA